MSYRNKMKYQFLSHQLSKFWQNTLIMLYKEQVYIALSSWFEYNDIAVATDFQS